MYLDTVVPGFSVLGFRALHGFRALCTGNQIWIYVINLPGFSALPGFKAPFHGDGQSGLNPGTTVCSNKKNRFVEYQSPNVRSIEVKFQNLSFHTFKYLEFT